MQALIKDGCLSIKGFTCNSTLFPAISTIIKLSDLIINDNEKTIFKNTIKGAYKEKVNKIQLEIRTTIEGVSNIICLFFTDICMPIHKNAINLYPNTKVNNCLLYYCGASTYKIENDGSLSYTTQRSQYHIAITKDGELYITR